MRHRILCCCFVIAFSPFACDMSAAATKFASCGTDAPVLVLDDDTVVGGVAPVSHRSIDGSSVVEYLYPAVPVAGNGKMEIRVYVDRSDAERVARKWARLRLVDTKDPRLLKEVILDRVATKGRLAWTHGSREADRQVISSPQSHPVFLPGMFVGIEFPISATRIKKDAIVLSHCPGVHLRPGEWYTTRTAVHGVASETREVQAFQKYISRHRPTPRGVHFNYNSWWTAPSPHHAEQDILGLMRVFDEKLYQAHGAAFDSFCVDMGWSDPKSLWRINTKRFPERFTRLQVAAETMGSHLGVWISPSSSYPTALSIPWAEANGYEVIKRRRRDCLCLGGPKYSTGLEKAISELAGNGRLWQLKLDGYAIECSEKNHGHEPGPLSREKTAEGIIAAMGAARRANPETWIETTCMGLNPSPWWLFYSNSVLGTFGDDAPWGRVPSPVHRESCTTARDFFNLQGSALLSLPIGGQEVLGIIHQTSEPMMNDAVTVILRGHEFVPVYVNPAHMTDRRWKSLAELMKWTRKNQKILAETVPLPPIGWQRGGAPRFSDNGEMPRTPYGYAHVHGDVGLVLLRNPWIARQSHELRLNEDLGFATDCKGLSAVSIYPEPRVYARNRKFGDVLDVTLAPYETLVLSFGADQTLDGVPSVSSARPAIAVSDCRSGVDRVSFSKLKETLGPEKTSRLGNAPALTRLTCEADVRVTAPKAELLILCEGEKASPTLVGHVTVNNREATPEEIVSDSQWGDSRLPRREHWTFLRVPLAPGNNAVAINEFVSGNCSRVSIWACASKPGNDSKYPNALPQPESISLDSVPLMTPKDVARPPAATEH